MPATERPRIVLATRSAHKLRELRQLLEPARIELIGLDEAGVPAGIDPLEDGTTYGANARIKARAYARLTGLLTLADDSGIEVDALGGAPGVHTRRYAGPDATDQDNNGKLLGALAALPPERRGARYVCVLVLADGRPGATSGAERTSGTAGTSGTAAAARRAGGPPIVFQTRGTCRGRIAAAPRGSGGFGYDPIFEPAAELPGGRTLGQWSAADKNRISHRARAARRMARRLAALFPTAGGGSS